jgi:hypothetical protein
MPCDTIQTSTIDLTNPNIKLLMEALHGKQLNPVLHQDGSITFRNGVFKNGKITLKNRGELTADQIKIAYSEQIVSYAAKQFGWKLTKDVTAKLRPGVAMVIKAKKG